MTTNTMMMTTKMTMLGRGISGRGVLAAALLAGINAGSAATLILPPPKGLPSVVSVVETPEWSTSGRWVYHYLVFSLPWEPGYDAVTLELCEEVGLTGHGATVWTTTERDDAGLRWTLEHGNKVAARFWVESDAAPVMSWATLRTPTGLERHAVQVPGCPAVPEPAAAAMAALAGVGLLLRRVRKGGTR